MEMDEKMFLFQCGKNDKGRNFLFVCSETCVKHGKSSINRFFFSLSDFVCALFGRPTLFSAIKQLVFGIISITIYVYNNHSLNIHSYIPLFAL